MFIEIKNDMVDIFVVKKKVNKFVFWSSKDKFFEVWIKILIIW